MIAVVCPGCSTRLKFGDDRAGEEIECPKCDATITVPAPVAKRRRDDEDDFEDEGDRRPRNDRIIRREAGNKIAAGICGILLGSLGIHKFILGLTQPGLIMLLVSLLTCGIGAVPMSIIGLIEGIIYLTKSDEEFVETYVRDKKGWF